jgi:peptidyl-tRNA hydrolase, PTH1 family
LEPDTPRVRLVAGLGNPGAEYERTRHNIGFAIIDALAREWNLTPQPERKWGALWAKGDRAILVKPITYMNRSGEPLAAVADFYKIAPEEILVVLDDFALPLGRLRLRLEGGPGGHNGLESVIVQLATEKIPRLRVGIGTAPDQDAVDYVLGRFFEQEQPLVKTTITRAVEAVNCAIDKGVVSAMNTFNQAQET